MFPLTLRKIFLCAACLLVLVPLRVHAAPLDADGDGLPDVDETSRYHTDPYNADTDGDGYKDGDEVQRGYSPREKKKVKLSDIDTDGDGLPDAVELALGTDILRIDSDGDGAGDGEEFRANTDPASVQAEPVDKHIEIHLKSQVLQYFFNHTAVAEFKVSSGKASTPTPVGTYHIQNKIPRAWSRMAGLWMPWWLGLGRGYGIHELPEWPGGFKEGAAHLGTPVSHGCVRLGVGPAKFVFNNTPVGTEVVISKQ